MHAFHIALAGLLALTAGPADAQKTQLMHNVEKGLTECGLRADVTRFDTKTLAALYLAIASPENEFETPCRELRHLLDKAQEKD